MDNHTDALTIREATRDDLPVVMALLAQDAVSARARPSTAVTDAVLAAFDHIDASADHQVVVGEVDGKVVGCFQLSFLTHLSYDGGTRAHLENVRVNADHRSRGYGDDLMRWAIDRARERGCHLLQLTSNRTRHRAHAFYRRLGFEDSHLGMKLHL